jgi:competence protein ComEA
MSAQWRKVLVTICLLLVACQQTAPIVVVPPPTAAPTASPTLAPVRVYVSGAVKTPGVYTLAPRSLVDDAVKAAGGAGTDADLDRINLALEVHDQQQIHVPRQGETSQPTTMNVTAASSATRININTATLADLDKLPKIGPATAQRIIDYRTKNGPFKKIEDLRNVSGIGDVTFEGLKDLATVEP